MRARLQSLLLRPEIGALFLLLLLVLLFELWPRVADGQDWAFVNRDNLGNLLGVLPELGIMAIGVTLLLIAGEFDLSVGSVSALTPVLAFEMMNAGDHLLNFHWSPWLAIPVSLLAAAAIGYVNGYVTLRFRIHSFVTTLGMLFAARSLAVVVSRGFPPATPDNAPLALAQTSWLGLTVALWILLAVALLVALLLGRTRFGNWLQATGGDRQAAHCSGIDTVLVKTMAFMACSLLAGLSGLIVALRMATATPSSGDGAELEALAATVIGGASLQGGIGTVVGALAGTTIIRSIEIGLIVARVDSNWFKFAVGALLILAVVFNATLRRWAGRLRIETRAEREQG